VGQLRTPRHIAYVLVALFLVCSQDLYSQSIFTSNLSGATGDWDDPATWTENNQGNPDDSDGIPDSDDDVVITGGDIVDLNPSGTTSITDLTIAGSTLNIPSNNRTLNVTGNMTVSCTSVLKVINMKGETLVEEVISGNQTQLDVNILQKGVYLVVIQNGNGEFKKKLLVN